MKYIYSDKELKFPHVMLVEASAGSGKTYLLSFRFVQFLLSDRIPKNNLENILAVTFTNNATYEMKRRILLWLKKIALSQLNEEEKERIYKNITSQKSLKTKAEETIEYILDNYHTLNVSTIDSFMTKVATASATELNLSPHLDIQMSKTQLIEEAIYTYLNSMEREEIRNLLDITRAFTPNKIDFFLVESLKEIVNKILAIEEITHQKPVNVEVELKKVKENVEKTGGTEKEQKIYKALLQMSIAHKIKEIINRRFHVLGKIHIGEITARLHSFLKEDNIPNIYFTLGDRLYHFMIDEFQDTNAIQWENFKVLINESLSKGGSLFVVGDIKQAIYGFRGSDYGIMKALHDDFKKGTLTEFPQIQKENMYLVTLPYNYRSKEEIIKYVDSVFKDTLKNEVNSTGDPSGFLTYNQEAKKENRDSGYVNIVQLEDEKEQKDAILSILKDLKSRNFDYDKIAILTEKNNNVIKISGWLTDEGIPVISESGTDIRRRKVIKEIEYLIKFLDSPTDDFSFACFLMGDIAQKTLGDNEEILKEYLKNKPHSPLYTFFREKKKELWDNYLDSLFKEVGYLSTYDVLLSIIDKFKILDNFLEETQAILKLLDVTLLLEEKGRGSIKHLIEVFEGDSSLDNLFQMDTSSSRGGVHVMTIHKAKGLEFDAVINLITDTFLFKFREPKAYYTNDGVIFMKIGKTETKNETSFAKTYEEQKQKFIIERLNKQYVAMTRARDELYNIVVSKKYNPFKNLKEESIGEKIIKEKRTSSTSHKINIIDASDFKFSIPLSKEKFIWTSNRLLEIKRGDFYHRIMSEIITIRDLEKLDEIIKKYSILLNFKNTEDVKAKIEKTVKNSKISEYFKLKENRVIKTELSYINRKGQIIRMDRVVIDPEIITVIDWKTGLLKIAQYEEQIKNYMETLKDIYDNAQTIKGIIFDIDTGEYNEWRI